MQGSKVSAVVEVTVRAYEPERDRDWARSTLERHLGGAVQARRGELVDALAPPALVAERGGEPVGLLVYRPDGDECELLALVAVEPDAGVGSALVAALREAVAGRCSRIWVVTTNDNLRALRFYQRRGFALSALRPGAVDDARRRLKPQISLVGGDGIPIRDELELELRLR